MWLYLLFLLSHFELLGSLTLGNFFVIELCSFDSPLKLNFCSTIWKYLVVCHISFQKSLHWNDIIYHQFSVFGASVDRTLEWKQYDFYLFLVVYYNWLIVISRAHAAAELLYDNIKNSHSCHWIGPHSHKVFYLNLAPVSFISLSRKQQCCDKLLLTMQYCLTQTAFYLASQKQNAVLSAWSKVIQVDTTYTVSYFICISHSVIMGSC